MSDSPSPFSDFCEHDASTPWVMEITYAPPQQWRATVAGEVAGEAHSAGAGEDFEGNYLFHYGL